MEEVCNDKNVCPALYLGGENEVWENCIIYIA